MNDNRIYYIRIRGRVIGPKELPDMQQLARRAQLNSRTPVSADGLSWLTAADFPEIFIRTTATAAPEQQLETAADAASAVVAEDWYFAINGQQHPNPVSLATLLSYVQAGTLGSGDLVFRSGWDNWRPVSSVPELSVTIQPAATGRTTQPAKAASQLTGPLVIAEFMPRVGATLLDGLFLGGINLLISCCTIIPFAFLAGTAGAAADNRFQAETIGSTVGVLAWVIIFFLTTLIGCLYYIVLDSSRKQGTWGKQIVGLKVVDLQGNRLTFGRAAGRCFGRYITLLIPFFIGFLIALFTEKKQTLHELMAGCLTVNA